MNSNIPDSTVLLFFYLSILLFVNRKGMSILIIWDFDWTLVNENTDTFVIKQLGGDLEYIHMKSKMKEMLWTELMNYQCQRLTSGENAKTKQEIDACIASIPVFQENLTAIRLAAANSNVIQCIVSDANTEFISAFLDNKEIQHCFHEIHTNNASYNDLGVLSVSPYHQHECTQCTRSPNMCKGLIVDDIISRNGTDGKFEKIIYLGDGRGDFCGCTRLRENDVILARSDYKLEKMVTSNDSGIAANIVSWSNGEDILTTITDAIS